jgi:CDP-diacylglycerol--glycerol-3-phosphate 3-phosphatidyltransferase
MLSRKYRKAFGELVRPMSLALHRRGFTAMRVTMAGLAFSAVSAFAYSKGYFAIGGGLLALAGLSDALDGSVARSSGGETPFGAFIDSVADRYSEFLTLGGIALHYAGTPVLLPVLLSLAGSVMVSYTRAKAESVTATCNVGLMERPERLILLAGGSLFGFMVPALWALAILTNLTAAHRIHHTWKMLQGGR